MGNNITVSQEDYDYKFTESEHYEYGRDLLKRKLQIARNDTAYGVNNHYGAKQAELYWSPKEGTIKGRVFEVKRIGDWNNPHLYYVKVLYDDIVNTKALLTAFNKSKGKRADSSIGHSWNKRWYTPFHDDSAMGNRMPLGEVWKQAKQNPYDFLGYALGIVNQRHL